MAIVRRSPHRWWVTFVTIAGAMLATASASALEIGGNGGCAVARGVTQEIAPIRAGADCPADGARSERAFPPGAHEHRIAFPELARSNDPCDDGTASDPSADETIDDLEDDDGKHLAFSAWFQETGRSSIVPEAGIAASWIEIPSPPSLSRHPLRC
jgi:hypothetical protein